MSKVGAVALLAVAVLPGGWLLWWLAGVLGRGQPVSEHSECKQ